MLIGQMRQSPPKGECTCRGSFDEVTEVEDLRSKRQLVPDYTAEGYLLLTKCAVAASSMRRYAGEGAIRFVTLDEMYAHRRAHRPLLADGPYDARGPAMHSGMAQLVEDLIGAPCLHAGEDEILLELFPNHAVYLLSLCTHVTLADAHSRKRPEAGPVKGASQFLTIALLAPQAHGAIPAPLAHAIRDEPHSPAPRHLCPKAMPTGTGPGRSFD